MSNTSAPQGMEGHDVFVLYRYTPSLAGAVIFTLLFLGSSLLHIYQLVRTKTWYFIPMVIGGLMEAIGYIGRCQSHADKEKLGPYIMQTLLLLVAPALYAASIYMILGRMIRLVGAEQYSIIPMRWLTKIFVLGDVLSFMMQGAGGGIMSSGNLDSMKLGEKIIIVGLFVQILFFGFFISVAIIFHKRIHERPTSLSVELLRMAPTMRDSWKSLLYILYWSSALILVRSIFRVIEYVQGNNGVLLRNELWLYIFDAFLMFVVIVTFNWLHPSRVVPGASKATHEGRDTMSLRSRQ